MSEKRLTVPRYIFIVPSENMGQTLSGWKLYASVTSLRSGPWRPTTQSNMTRMSGTIRVDSTQFFAGPSGLLAYARAALISRG